MTSSMPWKRAPSCATGPHLDGSIIVVYGIKFVNGQTRSKALATASTITASSHGYVHAIPSKFSHGLVSSFVRRDRSGICPVRIRFGYAGQHTDNGVGHRSASVR